MGKITFWSNSISIHQSSMIAALSSLTAQPTAVFVFGGLSAGRAVMGWTISDYGSATITQLGSIKDLISPFANATKEDVHIFSGIRGFPEVNKALRKALNTNCTIGVMAESPDPRGVKGLVRRLMYKQLATHYNPRINFILAAGEKGTTWFENVGFSKDKIYEFGYFFDIPTKLTQKTYIQKDLHSACRIIFIGSLIKRKGVDLLINALSRLTRRDFYVDIVGDGREREHLTRLIHDVHLENHIQIQGFLSNDQVIDLLACSDLLVLPSRHDGWGAVVNEALLKGTYVIASDCCGAVSLLASKKRGIVFHDSDIDSLTSALHSFLDAFFADESRRAEERRRASIWAERNISAKTSAQYLHAIIQHAVNPGGTPAPHPPWRQG